MHFNKRHITKVSQSDRGEAYVDVEITCPFCNGTTVLRPLRLAHLEAWAEGTLIQRAFPQLDENERELLISGVCAKCWNDTLGEGDD